jgi:hypothetical protein
LTIRYTGYKYTLVHKDTNIVGRTLWHGVSKRVARVIRKDQAIMVYVLTLEAFMLTKLLSLLKVSDAKTVSSIIYPDSKNPHSSVVQTQRQLNILVDTGKIKRGIGWYAVPGYEGQYLDHDKHRTSIIAQLIRIKLPISVYTEVSFPIGIRSDIVALLGRNGKGLCVVIEVVNTETPEYLQMKLNAWKNWSGATEALSNLFNCRIPSFSIVVSRNQPDDEFTKFIGGLK